MNNFKKWEIKKIDKKDFPPQLKVIKNCPEFLYYRGNWDNKIFEKSLAVVGSRRMSRYGQEISKKMVSELVMQKISIISGFMYGVDTQSHLSALEMGGITIAVLGGGLNVLTPPENEKLYWQILENKGLIISEYEKDFQPTLWSFPQRNRIVSGLSSLGVLVVEAGLKSGSLVTARIAREQGKKVWAIPGQIGCSVAEGTNYLIKNNLAKMVTESGDIFKKSAKTNQEVIFESLDPLENLILKELKVEALSMDELSIKSGIDVVQLSTKISMMALEEKVAEENGKVYLNSV